MKSETDNTLTPQKILVAAHAHVRRYGEAKTRIVDIARLLGTSHTNIYRHFRSKADVFDALVAVAMRDEEELAFSFVDAEGTASQRLTDLVLALHRRKRDRYMNDPKVYQLYRRVVDERPELVHNYAAAITRLLAAILEDGVQKREFNIADVDGAAEIVRDAITVFVHPSHVEAAAKAGHSMESAILRMMATLLVALKKGVPRTTSW